MADKLMLSRSIQAVGEQKGFLPGKTLHARYHDELAQTVGMSCRQREDVTITIASNASESCEVEKKKEPVDIECELGRHGYFIEEKIIVGVGAQKGCEYVCAYDRYGIRVFIELDEACEVAVEGDALYHIERSSCAKGLERADVMGYYKSSCPNVSGIAFVCDGSVCTVVMDPSSAAPVEKVFSLSSRCSPREGYLCSSKYPLPCPVVRLSEVRASPEFVEANIREVHERILETAHCKMQQECAEVAKLIDELNECYVEFCRVRCSLYDCVRQAICRIEEALRRFYAEFCQCDSDELWEKICLCRWNIRVRRELLIQIICLSKDCSECVCDTGVTIPLPLCQKQLLDSSLCVPSRDILCRTIQRLKQYIQHFNEKLCECDIFYVE